MMLLVCSISCNHPPHNHKHSTLEGINFPFENGFPFENREVVFPVTPLINDEGRDPVESTDWS
jgi:hypothetical protein